MDRLSPIPNVRMGEANVQRDIINDHFVIISATERECPHPLPVPIFCVCNVLRPNPSIVHVSLLALPFGLVGEQKVKKAKEPGNKDMQMTKKRFIIWKKIFMH